MKLNFKVKNLPFQIGLEADAERLLDKHMEQRQEAKRAKEEAKLRMYELKMQEKREKERQELRTLIILLISFFIILAIAMTMMFLEKNGII